jgi:hypothetical protein
MAAADVVVFSHLIVLSLDSSIVVRRLQHGEQIKMLFAKLYETIGFVPEKPRCLRG